MEKGTANQNEPVTTKASAPVEKRDDVDENETEEQKEKDAEKGVFLDDKQNHPTIKSLPGIHWPPFAWPLGECAAVNAKSQNEFQKYILVVQTATEFAGKAKTKSMTGSPLDNNLETEVVRDCANNCIDNFFQILRQVLGPRRGETQVISQFGVLMTIPLITTFLVENGWRQAVVNCVEMIVMLDPVLYIFEKFTKTPIPMRSSCAAGIVPRHWKEIRHIVPNDRGLHKKFAVSRYR
ncbi:hypothetical protein BBJ28_00016923 [Nothophytophthora sp. Chile5]|nr:hypothetical protein BBJ28_00016923 [Nothophytophthora sp. Chile5]